MKRWPSHLWVVGLCAALAACGNLPPEDASADGTRAPQRGGVREFERQQRERAMALEQKGRLGEAAYLWEVLATLRPTQYSERLAEVRKRIDDQAADRLQRARAAAKRGDIDAAERLCLSVLALQPDNAEAADALRSVDRARNKRDFLGQPSRVTLGRRSGSGSAPIGDPVEMEHAAMLAGQGELDDAILMLERRLKESPRDTAARQLLADIYLKQAEALRATDAAAARASLARSLKLEPTHAGALALQKQLR